jgi:hypothetical protein
LEAAQLILPTPVTSADHYLQNVLLKERCEIEDVTLQVLLLNEDFRTMIE